MVSLFGLLLTGWRSTEDRAALLLRHRSLSYYLEKDRPRATELLLTPPLVWRPAVDSGRWPGVARNMRDTDTGLGERAAHGRCCHGRKLAWPDCPKAIGPRFIAIARIRDEIRLEKSRGTESPLHFPPALESDGWRDVICIHRRDKCHALARRGCVRPLAWSCRVSGGLERRDATRLGTWLDVVTSMVVG
jgi:hypothetical protein